MYMYTYRYTFSNHKINRKSLIENLGKGEKKNGSKSTR